MTLVPSASRPDLNPPDSSIGIVGAGAFGTALAVILARAGRPVLLWARDGAQVELMAATRENASRLPGIGLPGGVTPTDDLASVARGTVLLLAVPSQATDEAAAALAPHLRDGTPVVACAKGIERGTGRLQSEIIAARLGAARVAALSGPGFADEIARGLPSAVTIAAGDLGLASSLAERLSCASFRVYATDDLVGVELGGACKNVLAIACGIVVGRKLGESARAALIARGLAEMTRLGVALGARPATFMGLSGLGDLVLTATSAKSRNLAFGVALGQGASADELTAAGRPLVEGAWTAGVAAGLARRHRIEMPLTEAVAEILAGRMGVDAAIEGLVSRKLRPENM